MASWWDQAPRWDQWTECAKTGVDRFGGQRARTGGGHYEDLDTALGNLYRRNAEGASYPSRYENPEDDPDYIPGF